MCLPQVSSVFKKVSPYILDCIVYIHTGCSNKSAKFNFVIKGTIYSKSADPLFQYKVHTLRRTVEHNIRQISTTTLLAHSCSFDETLNDIST
jgi:hypothetical protein